MADVNTEKRVLVGQSDDGRVPGVIRSSCLAVRIRRNFTASYVFQG